MLFQSTVPQVWQSLNIQADSAANLARKRETSKRLDFYHDQQLTHLESQLETLFSDPSTLVKLELNLVKKVINQLAQVYREPPTRQVEGSERDGELFKEIAQAMSLDVKLRQASRYAKLLKTVLLRPVWRNDSRLDLDIITGNICDVETGDSPEDVLKVLVTHYGNTDRIEVTYSLWTPEYWQRLNYRGQVTDEAANPYGVLPFLPVFDYPPPSNQFWLPGGDDLVSLQEAINLKLVDLIELLSQQSHGVGYIKGSPGGGNIRLAPGTMLELPADGEVGFVDQKARIKEVVDAIDRLIKWACVSNGLSASAMSTDAQEASGLSKIMDSKELTELRKDDVSLWRSYEKKLFSLVRTVWNAHNPTRKISDSTTLSVDFSDPQATETDPEKVAKAWDLQLAMGVISPVDIALEMNPDLATRENALAFLLKVKDEHRLLSDE